MSDDKGKHICGECEFHGKKDLCPWPKDFTFPRPAHERQCRAYHLLIKTRRERDEARAELLRARDGIDTACSQNRELARQLEALLEGSGDG